MTTGFSSLTFLFFPLVKAGSEHPAAQTNKITIIGQYHQTQSEMLSPVGSVHTGRATQFGSVVRFFAKWRRDSKEPRGRQSAGACESRPASQPGKITQRLELTSLSLANHLMTPTHPFQWEPCLGEGYRVWPHIHSLLFLPTNTAFSQILTASRL